jgi:prepilin-type N-terminal cleavage/methylation domain-containing protein
MRNNFIRQGFSLIEMLIVITVFSLLAYFVTQSTLQSFVGSRKADAQGKVRDNLSFAAAVVERNLRNSRIITYPSPCTGTVDHINYTDVFEKAGSFRCDLSNGYLASGSANVRITSSDILVTACSFTCSQPTSYNPPIIDLQLVGRATTGDGSEVSSVAISRRIVLRVY